MKNNTKSESVMYAESAVVGDGGSTTGATDPARPSVNNPNQSNNINNPNKHILHSPCATTNLLKNGKARGNSNPPRLRVY